MKPKKTKQDRPVTAFSVFTKKDNLILKKTWEYFGFL